MKKINFFKEYLETILTIIEDKPKYSIPLVIYKGIIAFSLLQIAIHIFDDFVTQSVGDSKLNSTIEILNMISFVNILNLKGEDALSLATYLILHSIIYLYFIYAAVLTLAKKYLKSYYIQYESVIIRINESLNLYFTFYLNVLLSQYIELNCSILFCTQNSLFSSMRNSALNNNSCNVPLWQNLLGVISLLIAIQTAFVINYFFRNYEFLEKNVMKRKSTFLSIVLIVIRILIPFTVYTSGLASHNYLKHVLAQVYCLISILDYFLSIPFSDKEISGFYLTALSYFEVTISLSNYFILANVMQGTQMFYTSTILSLILCGTLLQAFNYKYESIMVGCWNQEEIIPQLDFYLEQIATLGNSNMFDEEAKIKLIRCYKLHRSGCAVKNCVCHQNESLTTLSVEENVFIQQDIQETKGNDIQLDSINLPLLYKFIDGIFQWMLSQRCINKNTNEYEKLSLKYISFMMKYQNNPIRAYYELKVLQVKKFSFSLYFNIITNYISKEIQSLLKSSLDQGRGNDDSARGGSGGKLVKSAKSIIQQKLRTASKNELSVQVIVIIEDLCVKYLPVFLKIIDQKYQLWTNLQEGYKCMNDFQKEALHLMEFIRKTKSQFAFDVRKVFLQEPGVEKNLQFKKLQQIYYLFVINDTPKGQEVELDMNELKKMDTLADHSLLQNQNLIKGEVCILEISLSEDLGKIVSRKNDKTAQFFGHQGKQGFAKVNCINDLMPDFIAKVHNRFLKNFVSGKSRRAKAGGNTVSSFIKLHNGFINPAHIFFDFSFNTSKSDFRMNGVLLKKQTEIDYILMHRSGKLEGITQNLNNILFPQSHSNASKELLSRKLNMLLLFPNIIKKLIRYKETILEDLKNLLTLEHQISSNEILEKNQMNIKGSAAMKTLFEDQKSHTTFNSNPYNMLGKFLSYLSRKQNSKKYDDIDILSEESLDLLKEFQSYDISQSTNRSSERAGLQGSNQKKILTFATSSGKTSSIEYKMKFNFSVSYCFMDQESKQKQGNSKGAKKYGYRNNLDSEKKIEDFRDIYFSISFTNISTKIRPKKEKQQMKSSFIQNLATYLRSTTSLAQITHSIQHLQAKPFSLMDSVVDPSQTNTNEIIQNKSTSIIETFVKPSHLEMLSDFVNIPFKMIRPLLDFRQRYGVADKDNSFEKSDQGSPQKKLLQYSNDDDDDNNSEDSINSMDQNYETTHQKIMKKIASNQDPQIEKDWRNSQFENVLTKYSVDIETILQIDPNYQIKKILQNRSHSKEFSTSLETKFLELLFEQEQYQKSLSNNQADTGQIEQPITFRQMENLKNSELDISDRGQINTGMKNQLNQLSMRMGTNNQITELQNDYSVITDMHPHQTDLDVSHIKLNYLNLDYQNKQNSMSGLGGYANPNASTKDMTLSQQQQQQIQSKSQEKNQPSLQEMSKLSMNSKIIGFSHRDQSVLHNNEVDQQINKANSSEVNNFINSSNDKSNQKGGQNDVDLSHDQAIQNILLKKGLKDKQQVIQQSSIHSSSKSSANYSRLFLTEIILRGKIPIGAQKYKTILIFFFIAFISLTITNIMIINNDMQVFSNNVVVLRYPRRFLRAFAKTLYGFYIDLEIQMGFLNDPNGLYKSASSDYIQTGINEYETLYQQQAITLVQLGQSQEEASGIYYEDYYVYTLMQQSVQSIEKSLIFTSQEYPVLTIDPKFDQNLRIDSFLYLRKNYFTFGNDVNDSVDFLVNNTLNTVDSLILKFTVIIICAIFGIIAISIISVPILREINFYEEKIMMIVSRMNMEQAELEKSKYFVCQQLINIDQVDWLNYLYIDVYSIQLVGNKEGEQFNSKSPLKEKDYLNKLINSKADQFKVQPNAHLGQIKKGFIEESFINQNSSLQLKESQLHLQKASLQQPDQYIESAVTSKREEKSKSKSVKEHKKKEDKKDAFKLRENKNTKNSVKKDNNERKKHNNPSMINNSSLQSKLGNNSLRVFNRYIPMFVLTVINTAYFLVLIIYLTQSKNTLKIPVSMNKLSINMHIILTNLKLSTELLVMDSFIQQNLWSAYPLDDLQNFFDQMNQSIQTLANLEQQNLSIIYGSNPFPSSVVSQLKDFQEGRTCQYLTNYPCALVQSQTLGIQTIIAQKQSFLVEYSNILVPAQIDQATTEEYINSPAHTGEFILGFQQEDEIFNNYSSAINTSITSVSSQIQSFVQDYLAVAGSFFSLVILFTSLYNWSVIYKRIQLMNLLLTIIPEEKLLEDVTLHMIRQLTRL